MDFVSEADKPLVWLHGEVRTPPFSKEARVEAGVLLRRLQRRETLSNTTIARRHSHEQDKTRSPGGKGLANKLRC
jgi:hypothetical protein